jgi:conflict system STAND superfamily ATPase
MIWRLSTLFTRAVRQLPARRQDLAAAICPYRGLHAFREEDAGLFFGREVLSQRLLDRVLKNDLVAVIGPSGSDKSSVVQAGLLPLLRRQRPPEETWESLVFTPGNKPFHHLAARLVSLWSPPGRNLTDIGKSEKLGTRLANGEVALARFIDLALRHLPGTTRLIAVVDQFEELFTYSLEEEQRRRFVDQLLTATRDSKLTIVLSLRSDFYSHAVALKDLGDRLETGIVNARGDVAAGVEASHRSARRGDWPGV